MRQRRTKAAMGQLAEQLVSVLKEDHPQSARHLFHRMTDPRLPEPVEKSESGYVTVQRLLVSLRRSGAIPYAEMHPALMALTRLPIAALERAAAGRSTLGAGLWRRLAVLLGARAAVE